MHGSGRFVAANRLYNVAYTNSISGHIFKTFLATRVRIWYPNFGYPKGKTSVFSQGVKQAFLELIWIYMWYVVESDRIRTIILVGNKSVWICYLFGSFWMFLDLFGCFWICCDKFGYVQILRICKNWLPSGQICVDRFGHVWIFLDLFWYIWISTICSDM